jgi:hypothetical protein
MKMGKEVSSQGVFDIFSLFDKDTLDKVKQVVEAIDPDKVKAIMDMVEPEKGEIKLTIDLRIKK